MFIEDYPGDYEALRQTFYQFFEGMLIRGDCNIMLEVVVDDIVGVGMGEQGAYFNKEEMRAIYEAAMKMSPDKETRYSVEYGNIDIRMFSPNCASINGEVHLTATTGDQTKRKSFIQIASARKENCKWLWFMTAVNPVTISQESIEAYPLAFAEDTLARLKAELTETISEQTHLQQVLLDTIPHPIFYKGADTRFLGFNKAYCEVFQVSAQDLIGKRVMDLDYLPMEDRINYQKEDEKTIKECAHVSKEQTMPFANGKMHETLYSVTGFKKEDGSPGGLIGIFIDIADIREAERALTAAKKEVEEQKREIEKLAVTDMLTSIFNRRAFDDNLQTHWNAAICSDAPVSLILLDIDHFKKYNDVFGHVKGDECLRSVAEAMSRCLKRANDHVYRYGGEEYAVLLPGTDSNGAMLIAERIFNEIKSIRLPSPISGAYITISAGIHSVYPKSADDCEDLIKLADEALYAAKRNGRNQFVVYEPTRSNKALVQTLSNTIVPFSSGST